MSEQVQLTTIQRRAYNRIKDETARLKIGNMGFIYITPLGINNHTLKQLEQKGVIKMRGAYHAMIVLTAEEQKDLEYHDQMVKGLDIQPSTMSRADIIRELKEVGRSNTLPAFIVNFVDQLQLHYGSTLRVNIDPKALRAALQRVTAALTTNADMYSIVVAAEKIDWFKWMQEEHHIAAWYMNVVIHDDRPETFRQMVEKSQVKYLTDLATSVLGLIAAAEKGELDAGYVKPTTD